MSGGPPHHPHNRQVPSTNTAWNHLQVPNYFPRQPQLAHMSNEHSVLHQPTWHTSTTEAMKILPHTHMLSEMLKNDSVFRRDCVDLSLTRNGNQNGDLPPAPISLSVRDTNKINSLPPSVLEIQAVELTKCTSPIVKTISPGVNSASSGLISGLKSSSPGLKTAALKTASPIRKSISPGISTVNLPASLTITETTKTQKRSNVKVDSILERLNPTLEKLDKETKPTEQHVDKLVTLDRPQISDKLIINHNQSVIVQAVSSHDENSNSSGNTNVLTPLNLKEDDSGSMHSNEDSLDSNKSRRKRKPSKTIRVSKEEEEKHGKPTADEIDGVITVEEKQRPKTPEKDPLSISKLLEDNKISERRRSSDDLESIIPVKSRRKTSSESETIDDIAAMVQEGLKDKMKVAPDPDSIETVEPQAKPVTVSVIKSKENVKEESETIQNTPNTESTSNDIPPSSFITPEQNKESSNTHFVEVENKLEEMFAGIEDSKDPLKTEVSNCDPLKSEVSELGDKLDSSLLKVEDAVPSTSQEVVRKKKKISPKKKKRRLPVSRRSSEGSLDVPQKKKKFTKTKNSCFKTANCNSKTKKPLPTKVDTVKDIYAYDSGSNASSSRSRGPFIQIKGPRDSPISVSVVNTPTNDEDGEKKTQKTKKFHDDSEYRQRVRSKGLHCSTLSNKYDAQTKDATWICAFCKRGPHASDLTGPSSNGHDIPAGDLFGPYFISTQCPEFERRLDDPYDRNFKSKKIVNALDENALAKTGKKAKRKHSDVERKVDDVTDVYLGITDTGNNTYEVWAHEDCVVWSPGIYLVGPKIIGLEEAVWTSCNVQCRTCHLKGANICCLRRGCVNVTHLCCARKSDWQFDDNTFRAYCPQHRVP